MSFFNVMSYDMHGTWDKDSKWLGAYLSAHTNLTEIEDLGLDLLWRMNIPPGSTFPCSPVSLCNWQHD